MSTFTPPPQLRRLGICAPASPPPEIEGLGKILERLTQLGFQLTTSEHLSARTGYLAGTDQQRVADLHALFKNPEVDAIIALRGGYGSCRLLPLIDYELIRSHPKPLLGFSDITALLNTIYTRTGLVTFHGPNAGHMFQPTDGPGARSLLDVLAGTGNKELIGANSPFPAAPLETWVAGTARGVLLGGNLTCLERLIGTPFQPNFSNAILFLEDVQEKAYRVDGLFTHLRLAGILDQISGLVLGHFTHPDVGEQERIEETLRREAEAIGLPCLAGAPIGHGIEQMTVPVGKEAILDVTGKTLRLS